VTTLSMANPDAKILTAQFFAVCCGWTIHHSSYSKNVRRSE